MGSESDVSAADEVMRQAVDALRLYHEALPCASLEALEPLKADAKRKIRECQLVPRARPVLIHLAATLSPPTLV